MTISADGYRPRETVIKWPRTADLVIDIASTAKPYDETFFKQLARGALEEPEKDYALYRWSHQMNFYLKTQDEFGRPLTASVLETVRHGIRQGVHYYTAGTYEAIIEEGETHIVYVQTQPGQYVPAEIHTGIQGELFTQVVDGVNDEAQVVTFGSFFIDAEQKLKGTDAGPSAPTSNAAQPRH